MRAFARPNRQPTGHAQVGTWTVTEEHVLAVPGSKLTVDEIAQKADKAAAKPTQLHPTVSVTQHGQVTG